MILTLVLRLIVRLRLVVPSVQVGLVLYSDPGSLLLFLGLDVSDGKTLFVRGCSGELEPTPGCTNEGVSIYRQIIIEIPLFT